MSVLLVQLSDLHATETDNPAADRWEQLCRVVSAELDNEIIGCIIVFCGDAAFGGKADEFVVASDLISQLQRRLIDCRQDLLISVITVPGNHDCDLTSEDSTARELLRESVQNLRPPGSTERLLLEAQQNYFKFAKAISGENECLTPSEPYYVCVNATIEGVTLRFHLLNSSWTSVMHERDDLRFPVEEFKPPAESSADYSVVVMHHPPHWFLMPTVRRQLRDALESHADLMLTGHEHENESSRREVITDGGPTIEYCEGGVLQDPDDVDHCTFNIYRLELKNDRIRRKKFTWKETHFEELGESLEGPLKKNIASSDRPWKLKRQFEEWLDELEDPLCHPNCINLRLSQIFEYPDIRKFFDVGRLGRSESDKCMSERVRSADVHDEILGCSRAFVTGGDKSGKTSFAKRLYLEFTLDGRIPVLLRGGKIGRKTKPETLRRNISKALEEQYQNLTSTQYDQLDKRQRVLILDDLQDSPDNVTARDQLLSFYDERFGTIVITASDDYYVETLAEQASQQSSLLFQYQRYDICDFGHVRLEDLASKWIQIGHPDENPDELKPKVLQLCETIERLMGTAGLPHTPWVLLIMLEQSESTDSPAAKNGSYGHLYQAVITVALSRSRFGQFDVSGKYTYLSELAHYLHITKKSTLSDSEARGFHTKHCDKYDLTFAYETVRDDLIETRMLRMDGDEIAFRHKYTFCFFVAWWIAEGIHQQEAHECVRELSNHLYHVEASHILVFLAHLTKNPLVLQQMREAASRLLNQAPLATMEVDVQGLNTLDGADGFFQLPATEPEVNRRMLQDAHDESVTASRDPVMHDGRHARAIPDAEENETEGAYEELREIRAILRTIRILGQVLRNGASSMEASEKLAMMDSVYGLGRRVLGHFYCQDIGGIVGEVKERYIDIVQQESMEACEEGGVQEGVKVNQGIQDEALAFAHRFVFQIYWMASAGMIYRVATAVGADTLERTVERLTKQDECLTNELIELSIRLNRKDMHIPAEDIVRIHKKLLKEGNRLARVVLEALVWRRLMLYDTNYSQKQQVCEQMNIKVPAKSLDRKQKMFGKIQRK